MKIHLDFDVMWQWLKQKSFNATLYVPSLLMQWKRLKLNKSNHVATTLKNILNFPKASIDDHTKHKGC